LGGYQTLHEVNDVGDAGDLQARRDAQHESSLQIGIVMAVFAVTLLLLGVAAFLAWRATQAPFPGFLTEPTLVINGMGDSDWPGYAAGLEYQDHLIALDGRPLNDATALARELARYEAGDVVVFTVRTPEGVTRDVPVELEATPPNVWGNFFLLPYSLGLVYLGIGIWAFVARRRETAGQVFGLVCALVALALGLLFDLYTTHSLSRVWVIALSMIGSVLLHLGLVFPQRVRFLNHHSRLHYLAYAPGIIIAIVNQFTLLNFDAPRAYFGAWAPMFIFTSVGVVGFLAMMLYRARSSQSPIVQHQARVILWGSLLAFGPMAIWLVFSRFFEWLLSPVQFFPWLILFPLSIAYTILRYRLFNINLVVSRGVVYALLSAVIVGAYFFFLYLVSLIFGVTLQTNDPVVLGVFVLVLALLLHPARMRLQRAVDHVFLREAVDQREVMRQFVNRLTETTGLASVFQALDEALGTGWDLQFAALFLEGSQRGHYGPHVIGSGSFPVPDASFSKSGPLVRQMLGRRESIYLYDDRPLPADLEEEHALKSLRPALFIPVAGHGWITLGPKRSGQPFSSEDLSTLESLGAQMAVALEKARLFTDLEQRMTEVDVLRWVGQAVSFSMDVDDLMELIYAQTSRVLDANNFYIALYNAEKKTLSFAFYVEEGERLYKGDEWSVDIGLTGEIIRTGRPILTDDYLQECQHRGVTSGGRPGKAWMGAPLNAGDQVIGVMNVSSFEPGVSYTHEQLQFFSTIADQAAAIIDKARLYQEMEERAQQLAALNEVGSVITSTLDLSAVLHLIMDTAVDLLQAEAGSLVLVDQETEELVFEVTAGPGSADLVGMRLPPGTGIMGTVIQDMESVIIRDAQSDQRWGGDLDAAFVTRSIIAVPMISRGKPIGVIELLNRQDGGPFDEDDARLLTAFATNAAVSIENARLFTQTDQALAARVEELSMMQRIDRELNATLDYNRVMDLTLDWALRMTGAEVGLLAVVVETDDGVRGLRFLANQGYPQDQVAAYEDTLWPLDRGIIGRVVQTGLPELIEAVKSDPDYEEAVAGVVSQLTVPIRREDQIIGVIALESSQPALLDQGGLDFVIRLADHAAIAIENARLFDQVRRANDAKTEFVSFVSHELKQPMTSMRGYTDLLASGATGELSEVQRSFLDTIRSNVNRMNSLVSSLLDISRIESGRIRINLSDVSVEQVIEESLRTIRQQIDEKEQRLEVEVSPDLPLVRGDRERLIQVLTNLVSNAHKYTPSGGQIRVQARLQLGAEGNGARNGYVMCSVSDTGVGMSPQDQERLFTKYFRSEDPAVRSESGTGLGLVITKSLVELQGGEIWVESEQGQGSTFAFTIPVVS